MQTDFDVIVIGLGAMGSAALFQLAKRGVKVLGVDQFAPPHVYGSTHGETRITRLAVGEGSEYVPFVIRSHEIWREIEAETGYDLLTQCGGLIMASKSIVGIHHGESNFVRKTIEVAKQHNIKHEVLTANEIHERFPQFNLVGDEEGYYEPSAGFVNPEKCVKAQLYLAEKHGAVLKTNERVLSCEINSIKTDKATYNAQKIIVTAGAWVNHFLKGYEDKFKITRQVLFWFALESNFSQYKPDAMPIYIWMYGNGFDGYFYGFPSIDGTSIKVAREQFETESNIDEIKREVAKDEITSFYENCLRERLKDVGAKCVKASTCLYTQTPDSKFVIDYHPQHKNIIIASPCSGHGFKHSAAIGETLAQLAIDGMSKTDIAKFKLNHC
jgi:sarcosine oxidase